MTEVERALSRVRAGEQSERIGRGIEVIRAWYAAAGNHDVSAVLAAAERYRSFVNAAAEHERKALEASLVRRCDHGCDDAGGPNDVDPECPIYGWA